MDRCFHRAYPIISCARSSGGETSCTFKRGFHSINCVCSGHGIWPTTCNFTSGLSCYWFWPKGTCENRWYVGYIRTQPLIDRRPNVHIIIIIITYQTEDSINHHRIENSICTFLIDTVIGWADFIFHFLFSIFIFRFVYFADMPKLRWQLSHHFCWHRGLYRRWYRWNSIIHWKCPSRWNRLDFYTKNHGPVLDRMSWVCMCVVVRVTRTQYIFFVCWNFNLAFVHLGWARTELSAGVYMCAFTNFIFTLKQMHIFRWVCVHHIIYLTGMAAGYILNRFKSPPKVSPFINLILWAMSLCIMFLLVFGVWNGSLNQTWTAIYVSLGHTGRQTLARSCENMENKQYIFNRNDRNGRPSKMKMYVYALNIEF